MQDQVRLDRADGDVLPLAPGPQRHLGLEPARPKPVQPRLAEASRLVAPEQAVDRRRAGFEQALPDLWLEGDLTVALEGVDQVRQDGGEELAAHPVSHLPHLRQRLRHLRTVTPRSAMPHGLQAWRLFEQPDRRLPVHSRRLAELVQDSLLHLPAGSLIAGSQRCGVLPHRHSGHGASVPAPPYFGNSTFEAPLRPSVTKPLRQIATCSRPVILSAFWCLTGQ